MAQAQLSKYAHNRERGDSLVELALILPALLLMLFGILDLGRAVYAYHVVANCAREGARFGAAATRSASEIAAVVRNAAVGLDTAKLAVSVSYPGADKIRVQVNYTFDLLTPLVAQVLRRSSLALRSASTMYIGY